MGNAVVHFEIGGPDDQPLIAFYRQLFGWDLQTMPGGGYTLIDTRGGSGINGGIGKSQTGEPWFDLLRRGHRPAGSAGPGGVDGREDGHAGYRFRRHGDHRDVH